ncbi:MAG: hypothetical protein AAF389_00970 [Gemmatimonadota bacterium]
MKKVLTLSLLAASTIASPVGAQDPVALVIRVQGDVEVRHGDGSPAPAAVGEQMFVGDGVMPGDGSRAILVTSTGGQQVVTEETTMEAPRGTGNPDIFARAMRTLARAASADGATGGRQGMIRPLTCGVAPISPRNDLLVTGNTPTLMWSAIEGQTYDVAVQKLGSGERPQVYEVGTDTTFTLPEGDALDNGARYAWTIIPGGRRTGRACEQMHFRTMSLEESVELEDYMDEISVFGLDPMGDGLFLTVVAFRDLELFYDARDALVDVERQASLSADLYLLLGEILTEIGEGEAARSAFDRADELMR